MPLRETEGSYIGFYADVSGTMTLVAAKQSFEFEETAETIDVSHAENMWAPLPVLSIDATNDEFVLPGDRRIEVNTHPTVELVNAGTDDGEYEATDTSYDETDDETTVSVGSSLDGGDASGARALIIAPYGFMQKLPGQQDWTLSQDGILLMDTQTGSFEESYQALRDAKHDNEPIMVQVRYPAADGSVPKDESEGIITSLTTTAPYDEAATVSIEMEGSDPLVYST